MTLELRQDYTLANMLKVWREHIQAMNENAGLALDLETATRLADDIIGKQQFVIEKMMERDGTCHE